MPSQVGYETADIGHEATGAPSAGGKSTLLVVVSAVSNCRQTLVGRSIITAEERGRGRLENGVLLAVAEQAGFEVSRTADKNLRYQQNLSSRKIAIVVLSNSPWPLVRQHIVAIVDAVNAALPGSYVKADIPLPPKVPSIRS